MQPCFLHYASYSKEGQGNCNQKKVLFVKKGTLIEHGMVAPPIGLVPFIRINICPSTFNSANTFMFK